MSCVNLIFSFQPNFAMSSGIHLSLCQNCHHQIVFAKFYLKAHYPPPYKREVWRFKKANTDLIKRTINGFLREESFANLDINDIKVYLFNKIIKSILLYFMPYEHITFDNRGPPWINSQAKHLINEKMLYTKSISKITKTINLLQRFDPFRVK